MAIYICVCIVLMYTLIYISSGSSGSSSTASTYSSSGLAGTSGNNIPNKLPNKYTLNLTLPELQQKCEKEDWHSSLTTLVQLGDVKALELVAKSSIEDRIWDTFYYLETAHFAVETMEAGKRVQDIDIKTDIEIAIKLAMIQNTYKWRCNKCGKINSKDDNFCSKCMSII